MKCSFCGKNFDGNRVLEKAKLEILSGLVKNVERLKVCRECLFWQPER